MKKLSIIIPSYNEKNNVQILSKSLGESLGDIDYEIIFVDDSDDETPDIIKHLSDNNLRIRLLHRENEKGLASAVIEGFRIAEGEYLAVMDADLQHPPELILRMYRAINRGYDICIPSRFIPGGNDGGLNIWRKFVSFSAREIGKFSLCSLRYFSDVTGGVFMIKRECIEKADLQPIGWKILVEVLAMGNYFRVCEIPYVFNDRLTGESKISLGVSIDYLKQLRNLKRRENKRRKVLVEIVS